jgi:hypothetical protein
MKTIKLIGTNIPIILDDVDNAQNKEKISKFVIDLLLLYFTNKYILIVKIDKKNKSLLSKKILPNILGVKIKIIKPKIAK